MTKLIALYLPQFYPTKENDAWYGKGFTEWTNVAKAKPLFIGHNQPRIPADFGFYDLRLPEVIHEQEDMAKQYGIYGFSFYHYWFGEGKQLLEKPFEMVLKDKSFDFPFMLHWANGSWYKKLWEADTKNDKLLIEQKYGGEEDAISHFYALLPAFKDKRYIRINGKIMFAIDSPLNSPDIKKVIQIWRNLAIKEDIGEFFFLAHTANYKESMCLQKYGPDGLLGGKGLYEGAYDGMMDSHYRKVMYCSNFAKAKYIIRKKLHIPNTYSYRKAIKHVIKEYDRDERVFPEIFPRFDHSPRSHGKELVYTGDTPQLFYEYLYNTLDMIKDKKEENKIVFIRAWNEWGEGNYLEPDLKSGRGYLEAIKKAITKE